MRIPKNLHQVAQLRRCYLAGKGRLYLTSALELVGYVKLARLAG